MLNHPEFELYLTYHRNSHSLFGKNEGVKIKLSYTGNPGGTSKRRHFSKYTFMSLSEVS